MGLRFDIRIANWLAHVLDEQAPIPQLGNEWETAGALRLFFDQLRDRFYSPPWRKHEFGELIRLQGAFLPE